MSGQVCLYRRDQSATYEDTGEAKLLSLKDTLLLNLLAFSAFRLPHLNKAC